MLEPHPDLRIAELDAEIRSAENTLEAADILESELVAKLQDMQHRARETAWHALLQRYSVALDHYISTVRAAAVARKALVDIRESAIGMGCEGLLHRLPIQPPRPMLDEAAISEWRDVAKAELAAAHLPPRAEILVPVRFVQRYSIWNAGETAGFPAAEARQLIGWGVAKPASVPVEAPLPPQPSPEEEQ